MPPPCPPAATADAIPSPVSTAASPARRDRACSRPRAPRCASRVLATTGGREALKLILVSIMARPATGDPTSLPSLVGSDAVALTIGLDQRVEGGQRRVGLGRSEERR